MNNDHKLSEQDIDLIVDRVCDKIEKRLYLNVGRGVLGLVWKAVLIGLIALAAYGAGLHLFK